jgi:hypothetical protein
MVRIHFKDDGQDILWWEVNDEGIVEKCNLQELIWKGTRVIGCTAGEVKPQNIKPGDRLICDFGGKVGVKEFIHPVTKVKVLT